MLLHLIPGKATAPSDDDDEEEKDNGKDYIVHCADEIGPSQLDNAPQPSQPTQQYNTCCNQSIKLNTLQIIRLPFTFSKVSPYTLFGWMLFDINIKSEDMFLQIVLQCTLITNCL